MPPIYLAGLSRPTAHLPAPSPKETMRWMTKLARQGQMDAEIRLLSEQIVKGIFPHDYLSEYAAILNWIRINIRYVRDPRTVEQLKTARAIIETGTSDCDEMSILAATMIGSIGGQVRFVAGAFKRFPDGSPMFSHVWAEAFDPSTKSWIVIDPVPGRRVGKMLNSLVDTMVMMAIY